MNYLSKLLTLAFICGLMACSSDTLSTKQSDSSSSVTNEALSESSDSKPSSSIRPKAPSSTIDTQSSENSTEQTSSSFEGETSSEIAISSSEEPSSSGASLSKREKLREDLEYIFDEATPVKTYEIIIDKKALSRLDAAPAKEIYEYAHLVFKGDTIPDIQVRYKGSFGAWAHCVTGDEWSIDGEKKCIKLSMKLKLNSDKHPDRKFYGMKKLMFHHMHFYEDQLTERLAYWMHRQMGSYAPRAVHAKIKINGTIVGLFTHIEHIDGRFTRDRFEDGEGNVYKEIMPLKDDRLTFDGQLYGALKTNEDEQPTHEIWHSLEEAIDSANKPADIKAAIRKNMDVPSLVNSVLTSLSIMHWDSPYLRDDGHNSYWYADTLTGKLYTIPWDMDNADFIPRMAPFWAGMIEVHKEVKSALACNSQNRKNKLAKYWLCFPEAKESLDKLLEEVYPEINSKIDEWVAQIEPAHKQVRAANQGSFPETGALTMKQWKNAVNSLKERVEKGRKVVLGWK